MAYVDSDNDEWKNDGRSYRRILPGFLELTVKADGNRWRWTLLDKKRPIESGVAKTIDDATSAVKAAAKSHAD